ncbi:glycosyltransferase [Archangium minus]
MPPLLPTLRAWKDPADTGARAPSAGDLAEMIAAQRRVVESLRACRTGECAELTAHERTLALLTEQLRHIAPAGRPRVQEPVESARALADVLRFDPPPASHRKRLGRVVTVAKQLFLDGLQPLHVELLRAQNDFNARVCEVMDHLLVHRAASSRTDLSAWVRERLTPSSGARGPSGGGLPEALAPVLRGVLRRQESFNAAATEAFVLAGSPARPSAEVSSRRMRELETLMDPLGGGELPLPVRASAPLWREVFRRQMGFNQQVVVVLANLLEARPLPASVPSEDYPDGFFGREAARAREVEARLRELVRPPLLSVLLSRPPAREGWLAEAIESLRAQSHANWELLVPVPEGMPRAMSRAVEAWGHKDARVRPVSTRSGGVVSSVNTTLGEARGDFILFLEPEDRLAPHALAELVLRLEREPEVDVLYSDEDQLDVSGRRTRPFFKPDWSPDLLRSVDYVRSLLAVRRSLLVELRGLREGFAGAERHDLVLRLSERTLRIGHVPGVLYHVRREALPAGAPIADDAGARALREHLARGGESAEVKPVEGAWGGYHVRYPVRGEPLVSIIVPFKDRPDLLRMVTRSLLEGTTYRNWELLLVSNNSTHPETFAVLDGLTDPRIRKLTWDFPFNYPAINNFAAKHARGELLLFLNNDIEATQPDWLEVLIGHAQRPEVGAVGPKLLFPDGTVQHAGVVVGISGSAAHPFWRLPDARAWTPFGHADWTRNYLSVTSACVLLRREVWEAVGGFDERFVLCGSDIEIGFRLWARGLRVVYTPEAKLVHHESASRRLDAIPENDFWESFLAYRRYLREGDPFYNPYLTLTGTDGSVRTHAEDGEALAVQALAFELPSARSARPPGEAPAWRHASLHVRELDVAPALRARLRTQLEEGLAALGRKGRLERMTWWLPAFGEVTPELHATFRLAQALQRQHGLASEFVIVDAPEVRVEDLEARVVGALGSSVGRFHVLGEGARWAELSAGDVAVATDWKSALLLARHPEASVRAYLVQELASRCLPAGTAQALAEESYRLGLLGLFGAPDLQAVLSAEYGMRGVVLEPAVDTALFHAGASRPPRRPVKVFFEGDPSQGGAGFELGISVLRRLNADLGAGVDILTAGSWWSTEQLGLRGVVTHLGKLPAERRAAIYRECDVALCLPLGRVVPYTLLELMACGLTVVTSESPARSWLLAHEGNALLAPLSSAALLEQLHRAVSDAGVRARLGPAAAVRARQGSWNAQADALVSALLGRSRDMLEGPHRSIG